MTDLRWPDGPSVTSAPASMDTSPERLFARIGVTLGQLRWANAVLAAIAVTAPISHVLELPK